MIRIFKGLRKASIDKSKLQNYLKYAIGEILLIVSGILIALAINNKNAEHEKEIRFNTALNQFYTILYCDIGWHENSLEELIHKREIASIEYYNKDTITGKEIPLRIYYLNTTLPDYKINSQYLLNQLQDNIVSKDQNLLVNQINTYTSVWENWKDLSINHIDIKYFDPLLTKYNVPYYGVIEIEKEIAQEEIEKAIRIRKDKEYKVAVLSTINKLQDLSFSYNYRINEAKALLEYFDNKKYGLKLNFNNVGIIGTALPEGWNKSVPMQLIDPEKAIWMIKTELQDGVIKFRNGNNWIPGLKSLFRHQYI